MQKIVLMVPTYKRIDMLRKLIDSALNTAKDVENIKFAFCVNEKDIDTWKTISEQIYFPFGASQYQIVFENTNQPNLSLYYNLLYQNLRWKESNTIVSMVGDDMQFISPNWDEQIRQNIEYKSIIYLNDDYIAGEKLCVNLFTTRYIVDATEKPFMCEKFHAEMIDVVWFNVGNLTGLIKYLPNVILKHNHLMSKNIEDQDETYKRLEPLRNMYNNDKENFIYANKYAHIVAFNLINNGIGAWNEIIIK